MVQNRFYSNKSMFNFNNKHSNQDTKKQYFKLLVSVAYQDGFLDKSEIVWLCKIGENLGLGINAIKDLINSYKSYEIISLPQGSKEKFEQLYDVICIVLADDYLSESEIEFCIKLAKKLGFKQEIVGQLVRQIHFDIEKGLSKELIEKEVSYLIDNS